ncbi:hypothetical protein GOP47_0012996 [Adiantum capillus-veneris]|uniref:Pre-mRNA-processing protein 40C n=1 Tax=Adiantum capillus-veneris TaxID=13818 RepID=A0A9D4US48_ADICA|nr:hypothetical protein GOP47_0012494 [Adiantum capillus-veneris]KAI5072890.1 hypothetical protein GOP47_0012996 [Adiantum capillus-veneris]
MNAAFPNEMATQAWQPQSVQPATPGQTSMAGPQGQWQPSTSATQSQGMSAPLYNNASSLPPSPSDAVPQFRASNQANPDSLSSPQPQQSSTPPVGASLPQGSAIATSIGIPGYIPQAPSFAGPRWPPPSPAHNSQTGAPASVSQTGLSAPNSQINSVPQLAMLSTPQGLAVPPVIQPPSGAPWHPHRPPSSGLPAVSGPSSSPSTSASQESSTGKVPTAPLGAPSLTATPVATQASSSGLAVPSVALGPSLPAPSAPPGLAPVSVSQVPVNVSGQPTTPGLPGVPHPAAVSSSMPSVSVLPGPSGTLAPSESLAPSSSPGVASMTPAGTSSSTSLLIFPTIGSALPGPPGVSVHVSGARPSLTIPASTGAPCAGIMVVQQQQYVPYLSVPPVPPMLPWAQGQPRPFPPYINVPNPFLPPVRPVVPTITGNTMGKVSSDITAPLAPPGEQAPTGKASTAEGDKVLSVSSLSGQVVNGQATTNASNMISITSSIVTESALGSEVSAKVVEVADVWTAHRTQEGIIYYYNSVTGQSTYDQPLGFQGEVDKVAAQPTPVSWEMIGGTGWAMVTTNDAKRYYYHRDTQATSWQVPTEVVEYRKRRIDDVSLKPSTNSQHAKVNSEKGTVSFSLTVPSAGSLTQKPAPSTTTGSSALDLIKKKLQDSVAPGLVASDNAGSADGNSNRTLPTESSKEKGKDLHAEKSSSESSSDSDDEERGPTKEECVSQFKEMLKEKGIAPFSKWEKELPKVIFDPRFKAIPSHTERRSIFDHFVRTRAEEERKEKRAVQKAAVEGFKQLLEEASKDINYNTDYEKFAKKWGSDPRFEALERKDRESLLNERVLPLRKAEEERIRAIQSAAAAGFKAMLTELGEITSSSRWSKVKDKLRNDPRYRTVMREEREALFNAFVGELRSAEQAAERAVKAKREEEEKRKEREREKRKRKEREAQEGEKARAKILKKDATTSYQALLTEKVKDPEASWTESKPKLEKDPLGRANNPELDNVERERLFREHVKALYERALRDYRALLADTMATDAASKQNEEGKSMLNSWSEAKKHLKCDPRYGKMPRDDREAWWRRYAEDIQRKSKAGSNSSKEERHSGAEGGKTAALEGNRRSSSRR